MSNPGAVAKSRMPSRLTTASFPPLILFVSLLHRVQPGASGSAVQSSLACVRSGETFGAPSRGGWRDRSALAANQALGTPKPTAVRITASLTPPTVSSVSDMQLTYGAVPCRSCWIKLLVAVSREDPFVIHLPTCGNSGPAQLVPVDQHCTGVMPGSSSILVLGTDRAVHPQEIPTDTARSDDPAWLNMG